jgi:hypothetical protein
VIPLWLMLRSREAYVRHRPTSSSAAKLGLAQLWEESFSSLVVMIQELRGVVDQESRAGDYTGRVPPQFSSFTGEDDPHILLRRFTTDQLDLGSQAADLPSLY